MSPSVLRQLRIRLSGQRHLALEQGRQRLVLFMMIFVGIATVLFIKLVDLTLIKTVEAKTKNTAVKRPLRADIVDRNGVVLATSLKVQSLAANPRLIKDPQGLARKIVAIIPSLNEAAVIKHLAGTGRFSWVKRKISPHDVYALNALGEPGLLFMQEYERVYPNAMLAAHVLGYTDVDGAGIAGVEDFFNDQLVTTALHPAPLKLTLDSRVQHALEDEISKAVDQYQALGGFGIVIDVNTGAVVALASLPTLDPNAVESASDQAHFNAVTKGVYELGSCFKAFAVAEALDQGTTTPGKRYDATHPLHIAGFHIDDFHAQHRWMTMTDVFIHSSNIGTAEIADEFGTERQKEFLGKLGMLKAPSLEVAEVGKPIIPNPWGRLATMTVGYGHGLAVTPLQLASGMASLINGGYLVHPTLIDKPAEQNRERVISQTTSDTMRALFRLAVTQGTGSHADVDGYRIGGKTGTAIKPKGGGYAHHALISTFASAFPMDAPRYVVIASLDEPQAAIATGGLVAAPIVHNVILRSAPALGVQKSNSDVDMSALMPFVANKKIKKRVAA